MALTHYTATVREDGLLELPPDARRLVAPGQEIDIQLDLPKAVPSTLQPSEDFLAFMREVDQIHATMAESDPSDTDRMIREGRAGAMYGYPPTE